MTDQTPLQSKVKQADDLYVEYSHHLDRLLPEGPNKDYILSQLRLLNEYVVIAITTWPNGKPRTK